MKIHLYVVILISISYVCAANTGTIRKKYSKSNSYEEVERITKGIKYEVNPRAITLPSVFSLIDAVKMKLKDLGTWIASRENTDTFIGRCFGVARGIRIAMPLIMVKLGVIVTILIFLTIFSLKTLGLLLLSFMFNAGSVVGKIALWKAHSSQSQRPQNIHFHVYQSRKNLQGQLYPYADERNSIENLSSNTIENEPVYPEKMENLNLMSLYQQGFYNAYSTPPSNELNFDYKMGAFET